MLIQVGKILDRLNDKSFPSNFSTKCPKCKTEMFEITGIVKNSKKTYKYYGCSKCGHKIKIKG